MDKKSLSETDVRTKFITPALTAAGWDLLRQVREEVSFTAGRIIVRGRPHSRCTSKRADYVLYHQLNVPLAVIEAKDNKHSVGSGMQQARLQQAQLADALVSQAWSEHMPLHHARIHVLTAVHTR
jgi:type I restriction enzyme R subunit